MNQHAASQMKAKGFVFAIAALVIGACDFEKPSDYFVLITADNQSYELRPGDPIPRVQFEITNLGDQTVYFHCGDPYGYEISMDGQVLRPATLAYTQCSEADERRNSLEPGESTGRLRTVPYFSERVHPDSAIWYSYQTVLLKHAEGDEELEAWQRRSSKFQVFRLSDG